MSKIKRAAAISGEVYYRGAGVDACRFVLHTDFQAFNGVHIHNNSTCTKKTMLTRPLLSGQGASSGASHEILEKVVDVLTSSEEASGR